MGQSKKVTPYEVEILSDGQCRVIGILDDTRDDSVLWSTADELVVDIERSVIRSVNIANRAYQRGFEFAQKQFREAIGLIFNKNDVVTCTEEPYRVGTNSDGFTHVKGRGEGLGYYSHTLNSGLSWGVVEDELESACAERAVKIAKIAYNEGILVAKHRIRELME